jgi:hypothetical protein
LGLARKVGLPLSKIVAFELGSRSLSVLERSTLRSAVEGAGVIVVEENGKGRA